MLKRCGRNGVRIWRLANGKDDDPVHKKGYKPPPESIGSSYTPPRDLETPEDIRVQVMVQAESIAEQHYKCLVDSEYTQLSILPELQAEQRQEGIERTTQKLRDRYGHFCVQRGIMMADRPLSNLDTRDLPGSNGGIGQTAAFL